MDYWKKTKVEDGKRKWMEEIEMGVQSRDGEIGELNEKEWYERVKEKEYTLERGTVSKREEDTGEGESSEMGGIDCNYYYFWEIIIKNKLHMNFIISANNCSDIFLF